VLLARLRRQLAVPDPDPDLAALHLDLVRLSRGAVATLAPPGGTPPPDLFLPLELDVEGKTLSFFTTIFTFGTPRDITLQELRVETLFPADAETEQRVREIARRVAEEPPR